MGAAIKDFDNCIGSITLLTPFSLKKPKIIKLELNILDDSDNPKVKKIESFLRSNPQYIKDVRDIFNNNPMHYAAKHGIIESIKIIHKINPQLVTQKNIYGETPHFIAARNNNIDAFYYLQSISPLSYKTTNYLGDTLIELINRFDASSEKTSKNDKRLFERKTLEKVATIAVWIILGVVFVAKACKYI